MVVDTSSVVDTSPGLLAGWVCHAFNDSVAIVVLETAEEVDDFSVICVLT